MAPTNRAERRAATLSSIKACALEQLARQGAEALSLRHVAREMGMVSSGIYRYYPSRDALLTDLILDGYRDLAAHLRAAPGDHGAAALVERARALRAWAVAEPHRFLLVFGTPIVGYEAPAATVEGARETYAAFLAPAARPARLRGRRTPELSDTVSTQAQAVVDALDLPASPATVTRATGYMAQVVGLVMLELNGQLRGTFDPAEQFFEDTVQAAAAAFLTP